MKQMDSKQVYLFKEKRIVFGEEGAQSMFDEWINDRRAI